MNEGAEDTHRQWWPGRTTAIISGTLGAMALPLLVVGVWLTLSVVFRSPCDRRIAGHGGDYCGDQGLGEAIVFMAGAYATLVGGSMMLGAVVLSRWPRLRWRVLLAIVGAVFGTPFAIALALQLVVALR